MTDEMTDERLAEIRERAEAAMAGPWERVQSEFRDRAEQSVEGAAGQVVAFAGYGLEHMAPWQNAEFIAHARSDVPDLLAEVERLAAENADLRAKFARYWSEVPRRWIEGGPTP